MLEQSPSSEKLLAELKDIGSRAERSIIESDQQPYLPEQDRLRLRERLVQTGVSFKPFQEGQASFGEQTYVEKDALWDKTLPAQTVFCLACLGKENLSSLLRQSMAQAVEQSGGGVYKSSDQEAGVEEPTTEEVVSWAEEYFNGLLDSEIKYIPGKQSDGIGWRKNTIYRIEAIVSTTYTLLKTISFEPGQEAAAREFQSGTRAKKFLRDRVLNGKAKTLDKVDLQRSELEARTGDKIVRHLPDNTLPTIVGSLMA